MSAKQLGVIFQAFHNKVTKAVSLDEVLRAEIVFAVSALDCYVHDVVRIGMTKALPLGSGEPNAYMKFGVSMQCVKRLLRASSEGDRTSLLDQEIRRLHGFKTFQNATNISQALALIGIRKIWENVGSRLGMPATDVTTELNLIVDRRNKIAHEGDIDYSMGITSKYPIDLPMVQQAVTFLESLVTNMHAVIVANVSF